MKKPGLFAASVAAASATAFSSSSSSSSSNSTYGTQQEAELKQTRENQRSSSTEKFAPKFDGLRFIETLITAHR
ncbi:hypothetical protein I3843_Q022200 [Carya illinoinensis]|uniref:Uncharacterized protein n=2 Tax=Carya illinoinensis TaxID=32201 RepID=A0A922JRU6_CARIL|nr:hypothetical protein I3760_04G124400 [Carya illinoinensis]KAG6670996.1 hypothetical protein I3843_Q022200 [Carya illinoinensis]KAG6717905.1 hypothetical protein I3842_04G123900 [Carya illinoinensis]